MVDDTEPASTPAAAPAPARLTTLGRYRIERLLGEGGMGVVYAAFDPELERRVALKVLRDGDENRDARARLLREARAMARLSHPNVVTVHEVGTEGARDYVAMELVDGETLADWLQRPRSHTEIIHAFLAAGRGLAAAHRAELVHRDFKPQNVLRAKDGHIYVTDFGLARAVQTFRNDPFATTMPIGASRDEALPPPSTPQLTLPGHAIGTPAYMAPEQWNGSQIGPATDQFAFCVALFEALTGERPFRGTTTDELRAQIDRGPASVDASKLPRRLRAIVLRGFEPRPQDRWPDLDALLDALHDASRPRGSFLFGAGIAALALAIVAVVVTRGDRTTTPPCAAPAMTPEVAWPAQAADQLRRTNRGELAALFDAEVAAWRAARANVCRRPDASPKLACLDGALARLATARAAAVAGAPILDAVHDWLVDPAACERADPPRLALGPQPEAAAALEVLSRARAATDANRAEVIASATPIATAEAGDPCVRAVATFALATAAASPREHRAAASAGEPLVERCGDDQLRAWFVLELAQREAMAPGGQTPIEVTRQRAETALRRATQRNLEGKLALIDAQLAMDRGDRAAATTASDAAVAHFAKRGSPRQQISSALFRLRLEALAGGRERMRALRREFAALRERAKNDPKLWREINTDEATLLFTNGDVEAGHDALVQLWRARSHAPRANGKRASGIVVDQRGRPMPGVEVYAGMQVMATSLGILPFDWEDLQVATTDAQGRFAIEDGPPLGVVIATAKTLRSRPIEVGEDVRLVLEPTRSISGRVELGTHPASNTMVAVQHADVSSVMYHVMAPVAPDGSFVLHGAPTAELRFSLVVGVYGARGRNLTRVLPASPAPVTDVTMAVPPPGRAVHVIVRSTISTPHDNVMTVLLPGHPTPSTLGQILALPDGMPIEQSYARSAAGIAVPPEVARSIQPGDLLTTFDNVATSPVSACAMAVPANMLGAEREQLVTYRDKLLVRCVPIPDDANVVVLETPPQPRIDR